MTVKGVRKGKERKKKDPKERSVFIDLMNAIMVKDYGFWDNNPRSEKDFSFYAFIQIFSYDNDYCELVNMVNKSSLTKFLSKKQQYDLLMEIIPKGKVYLKSPRGKSTGGTTKDDYIIKVAEFFEVSQREARQYISLMGTEWADNVLSKFGGKVK
jgi:hypothetical protein